MRHRSGFQHSASSIENANNMDDALEADIAAGGGSSQPQHRGVVVRPAGILKRTGYVSVVNTDDRLVNEFEEFAENFSLEYEKQRTHSQPHVELASEGSPTGSSLMKLTVLGVDVSHMSRHAQFILCAGGVFGFSLIYGFLQELLSVQILNRQLGLFLALSQFVGYTFWSFLFRNYVEHKHGLSRVGRQPKLIAEGYYNRRGTVTSALTPSSSSQSLTDLGSETDSLIEEATSAAASAAAGTEIPTNMYIGLSILRAIDLGMTNLAMQYVNYPAKTLMKSSRVVFTMAFGLLFLRRKYKPVDYLVVGLMVTGLGTFLHADATSSAVFQPIGIVMLATSLMCDGAITNMSESLMKQYDVGQDEYIFRLYSIATLAIGLAAAYKGDLMEGTRFMLIPGTYDEVLAGTGLNSQYTVLKKFLIMTLFSTTGFLGSSCAAAITKEFGALTMSITSTARKATTLFISFMIFPNECSFEHVVGIFIFISSLIVKTGSKGSKKQSRPKRKVLPKIKAKTSAPNSANIEIGHMVV